MLAGCQSNTKQETAITYPQAATVDSADVFFGVKVPDPYRWLENDTAENTLAWVQAQNKTTNDYMAQIPFRDTIKKELTSLVNYARMTIPEKHGDYYYYFRIRDYKTRMCCTAIRTMGDSTDGELYLDPNTFSQGGAVTLQGTSFSPDGSLMAYLLSNGGSDWRMWSSKTSLRERSSATRSGM